MTDCALKLRECMDTFSPTERRVAEFFLKRQDTLVGTSIDEVARACSTSKTSVVRLCKQLGFKGYKDFCVALYAQRALEGAQPRAYPDVYPGGDLERIARLVTRRNLEGLESTVHLLSQDPLKEAVDALHEARRVDFYGVGNSGFVALDAQHKFLRIGKLSLTSLDSHMQIVSAATLAKGDAALFFSYSGETRDILATLDVAKESGATTIALTRYAPNTLASRVDIALHVASVEDTVRSGAMLSRLAMLHVLDILFSAVTALEYESARVPLDRSARAARLKKIK